MARGIEKLAAALFALIMLAVSTQYTLATDGENLEPPIKIRGFEYTYVARGQIHMNICRDAGCVPGSKVSYTLYAPDPNPDYEEFKLMQNMVAEHMQKRAPKGTVVKITEQKRAKDKLGTTFTNLRRITSAKGQKVFVKSTTMYTEKITLSVISSSEHKDTMNANAALFLIGLLAWSQTLADNQ